MGKRKLVFILVMLMVFCLSACSSNKSGTAYMDSYNYDYTGETKEARTLKENYEMDMEHAIPALDGGIESPPVLPAGRKLIRNISMTVETDAYDALISELQASINRLQGYVEQSGMSGSSQNNSGRYADMTIRIPLNQMNNFISAVETNGNVTNKSETTEDVTLHYSDLESRKKSLEIEQEKLWEFLEKAESVDTVITLQQRLSEIRYQLESMESQLKLYDNQVDYSTIHLNIYEVTVFTPVSEESVLTRIGNGFSNNFTALVTGITDFFVVIIATSPLWLPVLFIGAALVFFLPKHIKKKINGLRKPKKKEDNSTKDSSV